MGCYLKPEKIIYDTAINVQSFNCLQHKAPMLIYSTRYYRYQFHRKLRKIYIKKHSYFMQLCSRCISLQTHMQPKNNLILQNLNHKKKKNQKHRIGKYLLRLYVTEETFWLLALLVQNYPTYKFYSRTLGNIGKNNTWDKKYLL